MLDIRISDFDLAAFLDIYYPPYLTQEQAMEQLEFEILAIWDIDCDADGMTEEERDAPDELPSISYFWLHRVLNQRRKKEMDALSVEDHLDYLSKSLAAIWKYRAEKWDDIVAGKVPSLPEPLPLPTHKKGAVARKPRT